jgi:serine/threonine-protein kinase HipA
MKASAMTSASANPTPRRAAVSQHGQLAGHLEQSDDSAWTFTYCSGYSGPAISLTLPIQADAYVFAEFPPVFEGLLPEGPQLEALLRKHKIDRDDAFPQLIIVGADLVGSLTVSEVTASAQ